MYFTNKTQGPKGVHTKTGLVHVEPGATSEKLDVVSAEVDSAKATGWFDISDKAPKAAPEVEAEPKA